MQKVFLEVLTIIMKVNNYENINYNTSFQAGLTPQIAEDIRFCDVIRITNEFRNKGIETNFDNNKLVAWSSLICLKIAQSLGLGLPNSIYLEDFENLNIQNKDAVGLCNFAPTRLLNNSDKIIPEKSIFFNKDYFSCSLDDFDKKVDEDFLNNVSATNSFLEPFMHEFSHVMHENNMLKLFDGYELVNILIKVINPEYVVQFQNQYSKLLNNICKFASVNPLEAVAYKLSHFILKNSQSDLGINFKQFSNETETNINKMCIDFWNGKF